MTVDLLIAGLVFASVGAAAYAVLAVFFSEERKVAKAMREVTDWETRQASAAEPLLQPFASRVLGPIGSGIASAFSGLLPANSREKVRRNLELAGSPGSLTPEGLLGVRAVAAVVTAIAVLALVLARGAVFGGLGVVAPVVAAVLGYLAPSVWLIDLRQRRQHKIRKALPDMLDMLTISVQAGLGFDMALAKLVRSTTGPLSEEFGRMLREVQAGVSRRDALRHMAERTDVAELNNFIMAIVQADVFGVSVTGILRTQASEMRMRRKQRAEEQGQKAPVKMVFPIILCILPATLLVIAGPAVISIGRAFGLIR